MSKFNMNKRQTFEIVANRFKEVKTEPGRPWKCGVNGPDRIGFKSSKEGTFLGITLYGGYKKGDTHKVNLKLLKSDIFGDEVLCESKSVIKSDGNPTPVKVFVGDPVCLEANQLYKIEADRTGPNTFYGIGGESKVKMNDITITYSMHSGKNNDTDTDRGQIPGIILSF